MKNQFNHKEEPAHRRSLVAKRLAVCILGALICAIFATTAPIAAQDNPIPLTYRNLTVKAFEVNNNRNDALRQAKVTIEPEQTDRYVRFPKSGSINGARGYRFSKIPPSNVVGGYIITVDTKDCGSQSKKFRKNGGSDQIVTFTFTRCGKSGQNADEFARRGKGGYDVTVDVKAANGQRGNGYWVTAFDKNNKKIKRVRTGGDGQAEFRALDPKLVPYRFEAARFNKLDGSETLRKLDRNERILIDLSQQKPSQGQGKGKGSYAYDLRVKVDTPLMVYLKDSKGKTIAKMEYSSNGVKFDNVKKGGKYKVEFYFGNKRVASYDYSMPGRNASTSYRLDR